MSEINKLLYRILKALRDSMSTDEFDPYRISPEHLGVDKNTRNSILEQLLADGYIRGPELVQYIGETRPTVTQ